MPKSVAIVTGASQGIGESTAIRLARDFSSVVLVARSREHLDATAARVKDAGAEPLVLDLDLSDPSAAAPVVARTLAAFGRIDALAAKGSVVLMSSNSAVFPKAPYAAVGTINAAIVALAKAFADRGITDGVQVNSVLPGPVMTGRRRSYLEHWAPLHDMTVEEATRRFPAEAGIARYGEPEEIAELMAFLVSPGARWMTGSVLRMDGGEVKSI
jgi:NAD(P)-dependent dehydrogenase (short-subunit alcohol dehydrogenase family)